MKIRLKVGLVLLAVSLIPLSVFMMVGVDYMYTNLKEEIGRNYELLARDKAIAIATVLDRRVKEAEALATHPIIVQAVQEADASWTGKSKGDIQGEVEPIDRAWIASKGTSKEAQDTLNNDTSDFLRDYQGRDPLEYGELFITDRYGATVAMTAPLTDYYQADEGWWREGFAGGEGAVYLDDRGFDLSVGAVVTGVVVPVVVGSEVMGILKINFRMAHIPAVISNPYESEDVIVSLMRSRGNAVTSDKRHEIASEREVRTMVLGVVAGWFEDKHMGDEQITGFAKVRSSKPIYSRLVGPAAHKGIAGEGWGETAWYVFIDRSRSSAYQPISKLMMVSLTGAAIIIMFISLIAWRLAITFTRPLLHLRRGMEVIAHGDLDYSVDTHGSDEIGELSRDTDRMVARLKETLVSRDKLEREIVERSRAESVATRLGHIIEESLNEIFIFDAETLKFIQVNYGARTNLGYTLAEMQELTPIDIKPEFTLETFEEVIHPLRDGKKDLLVFKTVHIRKDGTLYNVEVHLQLMRRETPSVFIAIIQDITERLRMEEALRQSEKISSITNLAAGMAHELNNPLGAIAQNAQIVTRRLSPELSKNLETADEVGIDLERLQTYIKERKVNSLLEGIVQSCLHASDIIKKLIGLSERAELEQSCVKLSDVIDMAISMASTDYDLKHTYRFQDIAIERDYNPTLPGVPCQAEDVQMVILAVLRNSAQAMAGQERPSRIVVRTMQHDQKARIEIEDNGPGMPPEILGRIFEPLYTSASPQRKGLGLSTAYAIICDSHGGQMRAESGPGKGTEIIIELPLDKHRQ